MTYEEFWYGEYDIVKYKYDAYMQQMELEVSLMDSSAWLVGNYVRVAIGSVLDKKCRYPQMPEMRRKKPKTEEEFAVETFNKLERWRKGVHVKG